MNLKMISILIAVSFILSSGSHLIGNPTPSAKDGLETSLRSNLSYIGSNGSSLSHMLWRDRAYHPLDMNKKSGCKNIMAVGNATAGDYNLFMKVRDPGRPGLQVLCSIPKGYEYDYHHPWTGLNMHFTVNHKFIGTTTKGDVPPNITKPGMILTDVGLAFGDADTISYLVNPSRNAWDDFDWMRYAAQSADDIEEAITLLTRDIVDKMHAPSVAENIFVIGADSGVVIEADAFNYHIRKVEDVAVQTNYPKELWDIHALYPIFVARDFNSTFMGWVKNGERIHLGGFMGVRITDIGSQSITARLSPIGMSRRIALGDGEKLGSFWIELLDIQDGKAKIFLCFKYFMWESKMMDIIENRTGYITVKDMMNWSRIHSSTLGGLRGMCEGGYEASTVYQIPTEYPHFLSTLWFAADQCSSIFIPVHICSRDIYDPYETGEAHHVAFQLLEKYGHGNLTRIFEKPENAFLSETYSVEQKAIQLLKNGKKEEAIDLLTLSDINIQMKALLIEKMWLNMSYLPNVSNHLADEILDIWDNDYSDIGEIDDAINFISSLLKERNLNESDESHLRSIRRNLYSLASLIIFMQLTNLYMCKSQ